MYPMKLQPPLKDYLWGGNRLKNEYGKTAAFEKVAESWELSCHKDGSSVIANGEYRGMPLPEWIEKQGRGVLGKNGEAFSHFPVLVKLIDAADNLSVQVHPNDEYALQAEGEYGKTEMWYVVDCEPGAKLLYGFRREVSKEELRRRIEENTLLEVVNSVEVHPGDVFFIEAGTLHAIGAGILIAEIQQNSNTTYRIYDYGRLGKDGQPRELHIGKALEVVRRVPPERKPGPQGAPRIADGYTDTLLSSCECFTARLLAVDSRAELTADTDTFHSLLCLEGKLVLRSNWGDMPVEKGDSIFLQAGYGEYVLEGAGKLILTTV